MKSLRYDLVCKAGSTFRKSFAFRAGDTDGDPLDFTGFTARMQVRPAIDSPDVLVTLSTEDLSLIDGPTGTLEFVLEDGQLDLVIDAETTALFAKANYFYDIEIVSPGGEVDSPLYGRFKVLPEVTRIQV
jgi:hypothetical protein